MQGAVVWSDMLPTSKSADRLGANYGLDSTRNCWVGSTQVGCSLRVYGLGFRIRSPFSPVSITVVFHHMPRVEEARRRFVVVKGSSKALRLRPSVGIPRALGSLLLKTPRVFGKALVI